MANLGKRPLDDNVQKRSLWQSFAVLPAQTRLRISLAVTAFAVAGIYISDQLEKISPPPPQSSPKPSEFVDAADSNGSQ